MSSLLLSECNQTKEKEKGEDGLQMSMLSSSHGVLNHGVPGRPLDTNMSQKGGGLCLLTFIVRQTCGPCQTNANAPKMLVFQAGRGRGVEKFRNLFYSRKVFPCSRCSVRSLEALEKFLEIGIYY